MSARDRLLSYIATRSQPDRDALREQTEAALAEARADGAREEREACAKDAIDIMLDDGWYTVADAFAELRERIDRRGAR